MARKKKHEEHENHERWLVSYADFITLLFAFFVVMYSVSSVNEGKYRVLSESLVAAFRSPTKSLTPIQVGQVAKSPYSDSLNFRQMPSIIELPNLPPPRFEKDDAQPEPTGEQGGGGGSPSPEQVLQEISAEVQEALAPMIEQKLIQVRQNKYWVEVEISNSILFSSGSATLSREALPVLQRLAQILRNFPNTLHVEGFTDNVPISNLIFPSNWELSANRAASVVHLFAKFGIDPVRMVAIGYGEYRPVADNATEEGRQRNRRVVIVVQATSEVEEIGKSLTQLLPPTPKPQPTNEAAGGDSQPDEDRLAPPPTAVEDRSRPDPTVKIGKFPVIASPIHLPFIPLGSGGINPVGPPATGFERDVPTGLIP